MENLQAILLFAVGLLLLIKAGDWFVDGARRDSPRRFHIPDILIGATVVSIGTTLPEVMVSATSAVSGHGELAYGNAIAPSSAILQLIAAITIAVKPGPGRSRHDTPVRFYFIAAAFYAANAYLKGHFTRTERILLLLIFVAYMSVSVVQAIRDQQLQESSRRVQTRMMSSRTSWHLLTRSGRICCCCSLSAQP